MSWADEYFSGLAEFTRRALATHDPIEGQIIKIEKELYNEDFLNDKDYISGRISYHRSMVHMDERGDKLAQLYKIRDLQNEVDELKRNRNR